MVSERLSALSCLPVRAERPIRKRKGLESGRLPLTPSLTLTVRWLRGAPHQHAAAAVSSFRGDASQRPRKKKRNVRKHRRVCFVWNRIGGQVCATLRIPPP